MSETGQAQGKKKRHFTREQLVIWRRDNRGSMQGKSQEERKAARENMKSKLAEMSESERANLAKDLQAKWDALPAQEKRKILNREKQRAQLKRKNKRAESAEDDA
jgi:hypothetical protein